MQQGNHNVLETSAADRQESLCSEESDFSYEVATADDSNREFDRHTLDAFGVVSRSGQVSDDETYAKQVVPTAEDITSPKSLYQADEASFPTPLQSLASLQFQCGDGCTGDGEHQHISTFTDEDAAVEDTVRKNLVIDDAMQLAASADDGDDGNGVDDDVQRPVSVDDPQADDAARLTESQESESFDHVEEPISRMAEDADLLTHNSCSTDEATDEALFCDEPQTNTSMMSASESMQHEVPASSDVVSDQSADNIGRNPAPLDQPAAAGHWSWFRSAVFQAAQVVMYAYHYANV